jgi:choline dehydrogenase-like flavoprotein
MRTALDSKHTIVVGGGLAGLTAATYLARAGQRVTVLEKAQQPGGRPISDTPHGFTMNRGAHGLYTGDAASDVLNELRISYSHGSPKNIQALDARGVHRFPGDAMSLFQTSLFTRGVRPPRCVRLRLFRDRPDRGEKRSQLPTDVSSRATTHGRGWGPLRGPRRGSPRAGAAVHASGFFRRSGRHNPLARRGRDAYARRRRQSCRGSAHITTESASCSLRWSIAPQLATGEPRAFAAREQLLQIVRPW